MQQVTLKNTRVLFAAALPMNNRIVNKTRMPCWLPATPMKPAR